MIVLYLLWVDSTFFRLLGAHQKDYPCVEDHPPSAPCSPQQSSSAAPQDFLNPRVAKLKMTFRDHVPNGPKY